jgi:O-antigen/teichoic acid export membrane protein
MKRIISQAMFLAIVVMGINFLFKLYLSHTVDKEKLGLFFTLLDVVSLFVLLYAGYKDALIRMVAIGQCEAVSLPARLIYWGSSFVLATPLYLVAANMDKDDAVSLLLLILFFFLSQWSNYYSYMNAAFRNYRSMLFEKSVKAFTLVGSYFLLSLLFPELEALMGAYLLQSFIHSLYIRISSPEMFRVRYRSSERRAEMKFLRIAALSSATSIAGSLGLYLSSILMMNLYGNLNILAEYQVVVKSIFFALIAVFVHPVSAYTLPEVSKLIHDGHGDEVLRIERNLRKYLLFFLFLILLSLPWTPKMIGLIFPASYAHGALLLNWLLPLLPLIVYTSYSINILKGFGLFGEILVIRSAGALAFLISLWAFYRIGINERSIVLAMDVGYIVMFLGAFSRKRKMLA